MIKMIHTTFISDDNLINDIPFNIEYLQVVCATLLIFLVGWWGLDVLGHSTSYASFFYSLLAGIMQMCYVSDPAPIMILEDHLIQISKIP